jgi:hypothetical protein
VSRRFWLGTGVRRVKILIGSINNPAGSLGGRHCLAFAESIRYNSSVRATLRFRCSSHCDSNLDSTTKQARGNRRCTKDAEAPA